MEEKVINDINKSTLSSADRNEIKKILKGKKAENKDFWTLQNSF
jgi:hypothetical protein